MTPKCEEVQERIIELTEVDGALDDPELIPLRQHLEGCVDCQLKAHRLVNLLQLSKAVLSAPPESLADGEPTAEAEARRKGIRKRLGLLPSASELLGELAELSVSARLEKLKRAAKEIVELFELPHHGSFDGLWRVALSTGRGISSAAPPTSLGSTDDVIAYILELERQLEHGETLTLLDAADNDPVTSALLREMHDSSESPD